MMSSFRKRVDAEQATLEESVPVACPSCISVGRPEFCVRMCMEDWNVRHSEAIEQLGVQVQRIEDAVERLASERPAAPAEHSLFPTRASRALLRGSLRGSVHPTHRAPAPDGGYLRASFAQSRHAGSAGLGSGGLGSGFGSGELRPVKGAPSSSGSSRRHSVLFDEDESQEYYKRMRTQRQEKLRTSAGARCFGVMHSVRQRLSATGTPDSIKPVASCAQWIVKSTAFDVICAIMILANAVIVGIETEYLVEHPNTSQTFSSLYMALNCWYFLELMLKLCAEGCRFFYSDDWKWNLFDFFLIFSSLLDMLAESMDTGALELGRLLRAIRLFRIVRTVRIVRLLVYLYEFRKMAVSLMSSVQTLFWSLVLLFFIIYTFGVWLTQAVSVHLHTNPEAKAVDGLVVNYGTLGSTIYTLYKCISTGLNWGILVEPLSAIDQTAAGLFVIFISISFFGVLNIVTSVFVESAMQTTRRYRDLMLQDSFHQQNIYVKHLKEIFSVIDTDDSGTINLLELKEFIMNEQPQLRDYFDALELNATNLHALFRLLDHDGSGSIDINEFCDGCMRLKGEARSFDLNCVLYENRRLHRHLTQHIKKTDDALHSIALSTAMIARKLRDGALQKDLAGPGHSKAASKLANAAADYVMPLPGAAQLESTSAALLAGGRPLAGLKPSPPAPPIAAVGDGDEDVDGGEEDTVEADDCGFALPMPPAQAAGDDDKDPGESLETLAEVDEEDLDEYELDEEGFAK